LVSFSLAPIYIPFLFWQVKIPQFSFFGILLFVNVTIMTLLSTFRKVTNSYGPLFTMYVSKARRFARSEALALEHYMGAGTGWTVMEAYFFPTG
jgi:hypothetical protein